MSTLRTLLDDLAPEARDRLLEHSHPVRFAAGTRIFHERRRADRFWIIESGRVELDMHVPGHSNAVVDTLASGALLGCSWLIPPYQWHLGATATTDVRALEFDARAVRELCDAEPSVGEALLACVAATMARRLLSARSRLLDDLMPRVSAEPLAYAR
ncbi:cyclic nucleotide-binding domain-containing protein [Streptomyces sp. NPDC056056]|uniref:cyclic nucleotide-binding domain-containing protein n=1 Tax=Streptomyces sp. NPDC056056 TaxID=3345698 RepID=UPI0035DD6DA8